MTFSDNLSRPVSGRKFLVMGVSGCVLAASLVVGISAQAGIAELEVLPWDLDEAVQCYADETLEATRPPTTFSSPLELETDAAYAIYQERVFAYEAAKDSYDAAKIAARPSIDPNVTVTNQEAIIAQTRWVAILTAEKLLNDLQAARAQNYLEDVRDIVENPGLTLGNLFSDDADGDPQIVNYLDDTYNSSSGVGDTVFGVVTDPGGTAIDTSLGLAQTVVTSEIAGAIGTAILPGVEERAMQRQAEAETAGATLAQAEARLFVLINDGINFSLTRPASLENLEALELATEALALAKSERDAAYRDYITALDVALASPPEAPFCDSREFGVALLEFCANPPQLTEQEIADGGNQEAVNEVVRGVCALANDALDGIEITSNNGDDEATIRMPENQTDVTIINAIQDGFVSLPPGTIIYSLTGTDQLLFDIDADTGVLVFKTAPNFEEPSDDNNDNIYEIEVKAEDSTARSDTQSLKITIENVQGPDDPDDTRTTDFTKRVITNFMSRRAKVISANEPDLTARLKLRGQSDHNAVSFSGHDGTSGYTMTFATSLARLASASREPGPELRTRSAFDGRFDVWAEGTRSRSEVFTTESKVSQYFVGADYQVNNDWVVGVMAQTDKVEETDKILGTHIEGTGWMAGPYVVGRLRENLYVDGRVAYGQSNNEINPFGDYTDEFDTERYLISAKLTGEILVDEWTVAPHLGVRYFSETQESYTDTLGYTIPKQTINLGQVSFGPKVSRRFSTAKDTVIEPYLSLTGYWNFDDAALVDPNTGLTYSAKDIEARTEGGVAVRLAQGWQFTGSAFYGGIADRERKTYGARLGVSKAF